MFWQLNLKNAKFKQMADVNLWSDRAFCISADMGIDKFSDRNEKNNSPQIVYYTRVDYVRKIL